MLAPSKSAWSSPPIQRRNSKSCKANTTNFSYSSLTKTSSCNLSLASSCLRRDWASTSGGKDAFLSWNKITITRKFIYHLNRWKRMASISRMCHPSTTSSQLSSISKPWSWKDSRPPQHRAKVRILVGSRKSTSNPSKPATKTWWSGSIWKRLANRATQISKWCWSADSSVRFTTTRRWPTSAISLVLLEPSSKIHTTSDRSIRTWPAWFQFCMGSELASSTTCWTLGYCWRTP